MQTLIDFYVIGLVFHRGRMTSGQHVVAHVLETLERPIAYFEDGVSPCPPPTEMEGCSVCRSQCLWAQTPCCPPGVSRLAREFSHILSVQRYWPGPDT